MSVDQLHRTIEEIGLLMVVLSCIGTVLSLAGLLYVVLMMILDDMHKRCIAKRLRNSKPRKHP